jgi:O-antigen/teichoic acid export membrane protein
MSKLSSSILKGFGANAFGQVVTIITQVVQIPVLLHLYGVNLVGEWLLISAIPSYIALSDVGLSNVAANAVSLHIAGGQVEKARHVTQSLCRFIVVLCVMMLIFSSALAFLIDWNALLKFTMMSQAESAWVVFLLSAGAVAFLGSGLFYGTYRGCGLGPRIMIIMNCGRLVELAALLIAWMAGFSPVWFAALLLLLRCGFIAYVIMDNKRHCSSLPLGFSMGSWGKVREMLRPAFSFMMFPLGNSIYFQGLSFVVNATMGAPAVVVYNACRVVSRVVPMATQVVRQTLWIEYPALFATGQVKKILTLQRGAAGLTWLLIVAMLAVIIPLGPWLIGIWTMGDVSIDRILLGLFVLVAGVNAMWNINSTLLLSINKHERFSLLYIVCMVAALAFSYVGGFIWGFYALAGGLIISEVPLCVYCSRLTCELVGDESSEFWMDVVCGRSAIRMLHKIAVSYIRS